MPWLSLSKIRIGQSDKFWRFQHVGWRWWRAKPLDSKWFWTIVRCHIARTCIDPLDNTHTHTPRHKHTSSAHGFAATLNPTHPELNELATVSNNAKSTTTTTTTSQRIRASPVVTAASGPPFLSRIAMCTFRSRSFLSRSCYRPVLPPPASAVSGNYSMCIVGFLSLWKVVDPSYSPIGKYIHSLLFACVCFSICCVYVCFYTHTLSAGWVSSLSDATAPLCYVRVFTDITHFFPPLFSAGPQHVSIVVDFFPCF